MPSRLLLGILPAALPETFTFWQSAESPCLLTGRRIASDDSTPVGQSRASTELRVVLAADTGVIFKARVVRLEEGQSPLLLCDILGAKPQSSLGCLRSLLSACESLAHVLVWSRDTPKQGQPVRVALVELPRLKLSFVAKRSPGTGDRLYSNEYHGWFVATRVHDTAALTPSLDTEQCYRTRCHVCSSQAEPMAPCAGACAALG